MNTNFKVGDKVRLTGKGTCGVLLKYKGFHAVVREALHNEYRIKVEGRRYNNCLIASDEDIEKVSVEERITNEAGGVKADGMKLRYDLIPVACEKEVVKVLTYGAQKYDDNNWMKVEPHRYIGAIRRHLAQYQAGEAFDEESGMHHLAHAVSSLMFIMYHDLKEKDE